jgi:penicillin-binding protein 2
MSEKGTSIKVFTYLTLLILLIFVLRLWQLQILKGDYYREKSKKNRVRIVKIPSPRGIIYDRNEIPLVKNAPYFIASLIPDLSVAEINLTELSIILSVPVEKLSDKIIYQKSHTLEPIRLKEGLRFEEVAKIEARRSDFPGLIVETEITREYPYSKTGAHIIGYLSKPTEEQLRKGLFKNTTRGSVVGQWGVESLYNEELTGTTGRRFIEVDALGRQLSTLRVIHPRRGEDIQLSIDIRTQSVAEEAFQKKAGALLALDPNDGSVLALVSLPSFDSNLFVKGISPPEWQKVLKHPGHPFLNRVFQSRYPPGSVFKIVTALAALEEGAINEHFTVECKGKIEVGRWKYRCWKERGHGKISLKRALIESCDVYFYEVGRLLGIDRIAKYASALGLGKVPGMKLSTEKAGLIPSSSWKVKSKGEPWYLGETFNASIGQGYVSLTPAHAALLIAAIANGGNVYRPVLRTPTDIEPIAKLSVKPETMDVIREALIGVVNSQRGTGKTASSERVVIAGKTGTAQVVALPELEEELPVDAPRDHAWFVAYAPADRPAIALSVFVEHGGHGGEVAAPIAKVTIEEYLR